MSGLVSVCRLTLFPRSYVVWVIGFVLKRFTGLVMTCLTAAVCHQTKIATLVERKSRQTLLAALPDGYDAVNTAKAVTEALGKQPAHLVKTLTWDHRREMTRWADIEKNLNIKNHT